jgi:hypothetical protein
MRFADSSCARFLRARLASQCWFDPYGHHQCDGGWDGLACEEWEDSIFGAVQGLGWWLRSMPVRGRRWVLGVRRVGNQAEMNIEQSSVLLALAEMLCLATFHFCGLVL